MGFGFDFDDMATYRSTSHSGGKRGVRDGCDRNPSVKTRSAGARSMFGACRRGARGYAPSGKGDGACDNALGIPGHPSDALRVPARGGTGTCWAGCVEGLRQVPRRRAHRSQWITPPCRRFNSDEPRHQRLPPSICGVLRGVILDT